MIDNYPIILPENKLKQWEDDILNERQNVDVVLDCVWRDGYRAGADDRLEACCEWLEDTICDDPQQTAKQLRAAFRPNPRLAEKALKLINKIQNNKEMWQLDELNVVCDALERLKELEKNDD